jgi:hypothetical protein
MRTRLLLAAVAVSASLAACGSDDPNPSSAPSDPAANNQKAMIAFAGCMRKNGVDMPDPQFDGGRVMMRGPRNVDEGKMRTAEKACAKYRDSVKPPELSDEERDEFRKEALANAKCMREHGIDFPDPTFEANGGARVRIGRGSGIDPESPKFQEAQKACQSTMPGPDREDEQ